MNLYQLDAAYRADVATLQDIDLPPETVLDTIDGMQGEISEKIKAVMIVAMEIEAEAKVRAEHAKRMADSAKAMAGRADALRSYAQVAIQNCGLMLPLKYPEFSINLQRNPPSCEVTKPELLPPDMKSLNVTFSLSGLWSHQTPESMLALLKVSGFNATDVSVEMKVDKKAVLDALKAVAIENDKRKVLSDASVASGNGPILTDPDRLLGAHINPTGFRITVK